MGRTASHLAAGALLGAGAGLLAAGGYLLLGGDAGAVMPDWAVAIFTPGVLAGLAAHRFAGLSEGACVAIGVAGVGVGYAVVGILVAAARLAVRRRVRKGRG
jgi:hypothetical protein